MKDKQQESGNNNKFLRPMIIGNAISQPLRDWDPENGKLTFVLISKPSHGRIIQFSSSSGTLAYIPDENYDGKDSFGFKVHDGTDFSNNAKVSIKIENNEKLNNDKVQQDQQPNKESSQTSTNDKQANDDKSNNNTPPNESNQQSTSSTQDTEEPKKDLKEEETSPPENTPTDSGDEPSGDSPPTPGS